MMLTKQCRCNFHSQNHLTNRFDYTSPLARIDLQFVYIYILCLFFIIFVSQIYFTDFAFPLSFILVSPVLLFGLFWPIKGLKIFSRLLRVRAGKHLLVGHSSYRLRRSKVRVFFLVVRVASSTFPDAIFLIIRQLWKM